MCKIQKVFYGFLSLFAILVLTAGPATAECTHIIQSEYIEAFVPCRWDSAKHERFSYYIDRCQICNYVYESEPYSDEEYHFKLDENGVCPECQYQADPACAHENIGYGGEGWFIDSSVAFTATQHCGVNINEICCSDCGKFLREEEKGYWENHEFNFIYRDGYCICGCPDPSIELLPLSVTMHTWETEVNVGERFSVSETVKCGSGRFEKIWYAYSDTGLSVSDEWQLKAEKPGTWIFQLTVNDLVTGESITVQSEPITIISDCTHENIQSGSVSYSVDAQVPHTETQHYAQRETQQYCGDCGESVDALIDGVWEDHFFNADGTCACGLPSSEILSVLLTADVSKVCIGEAFGVTAAYTGGSGQYVLEWKANSSAGETVSGHDSIAVQQPGTWRFELTLTDTVTGETARAHSDPITVRDHTVSSTEIGTVWKPCTGDKKQHYAATTSTVDICSHCQAELPDNGVRYQYDENTAPFIQPHDFAGNTCSLCGFYDQRYSLYCPDAQYAYLGYVLISRESSAQVMVRDNHTGEVFPWYELDGMRLECQPKGDATLSDRGYLWINYGSIAIDLYYQDTLLDTLTVGAAWLDVTTWGWNEGKGSGTLILRMKDLQDVEWKKNGLWLNSDANRNIAMFDFDARRQGDYYIVTFDIYNSTPVTFGVASYYADGSECDRQLIEGYTPDYGLTAGIITWGQVVIDSFSPRYGDSGAWTQKTKVSLRVPINGAFFFLEPDDDTELALHNAVQLWLAILKNSRNFAELLLPGDIEAQKAVQEALKDAKTWQKFLDEVKGQLMDKLGSELEPKDFLKMTESISDFGFDLLENEDIADALLGALEKLALDVTVRTAVDVADTAVLLKAGNGLGAVYALQFMSSAMDLSSVLTHFKLMNRYAENDIDIIQIIAVLVPAADSVSD